MGLRDDIKDTPGKEPVVVKMSDQDQFSIAQVLYFAHNAKDYAEYYSKMSATSAPVEAALHDFSLALDQAIKDHLNKVRTDD